MALPALLREKRPSLPSWKPFQTNLPSEAQVSGWFDDAEAICLLTGHSSRNLELLDFDCKGEKFQAWSEAIKAEAPDLYAKLVIERSPSGGYHVVYSTGEEKVGGNRKLASRIEVVADNEEAEFFGKKYKPRKNGDHWEVILTPIETRGDGGLFLCDPSPGYTLIQGDLSNPPLLSAIEREFLIDTAKSFNEIIPATEPHQVDPTVGTRPGDDYNQRSDVRELLIAHGWRLVKPGENEYWRRPGKDFGVSATLKGKSFYVFSSNAQPFESDRAYGPFSVYAHLEHSGNFSRAAKEIKRLGYGSSEPSENKKSTNGQGYPPEDLKPLDWEKETGSKLLSGDDLLGYLDLPTDYVVSPWIVRGGITQLQGDPKAGKSVFALYLSIAAAMGHTEEYLGVSEPRTVLYLHYEDATTLVAKRVDQFMRGMGHSPGTMPTNLVVCYFPRLNLDSVTTQRLIKEKISEIKADMLVLDTLSYVHEAEENSATEMRPIMYALKEIAFETQAGILYLHHTAKGSDERAMVQRGRGSSVITAAADVVVHWGDRGGTDTTPVSIQSKYESAMELSVDYIKKANEEGLSPERMCPVAWGFRDAVQADSAEDRAGCLVPIASEFEKSSPEGISATELKMLSRLKERTFYKYLKICVDLKLLIETGKGKSKRYYAKKT